MIVHGVVVVYYPTHKVVENIKTYIDSLVSLYVVENTPNIDNSKMFSFDAKIHYISLGKNRGIATALNVGAKNAIKNKADWLLTMDQDSRFYKNAFGKMIEFLKEFSTDKNDLLKVGNDYKKTAIISPCHCTVLNSGRKLEGFSKPLTVMTSGNLLNLNIYREIGGFKDWMFIDCVDFDYCFECRKKGYEIVQLNWIKLKHNLGNISVHKFFNRKVYTDNHSAFRRYYIVRNRHYLFDMHSDKFYRACKIELYQTRYEVIRIILFEKDKIRKLVAMFKGYIDYKRGKKG